MLLATAVVLAFVSLLIYWKRKSALWTAISKIPGPKPVPIFGNVLRLVGPLEDLLPNVLKLIEEQMPLGIARMYLGSKPYVVLFKAEYIESLLSSPNHIDKSDDYDFLIPWLKFGVLVSSGEKWHHRRRILNPAFHFQILNDFLAIFNEQSEILVKSLRKEVGKESCDIFPYISRAALDMICETAMGCSANAQKDGKSEYVNAIHTATAALFNRMIYPWLHPDIIFNNLKVGKDHANALKIIHGFSKQVIARRKDEYNTKKRNGNSNSEESVYGKKPRLAILDSLLEYSEVGQVLNDYDIQEEVDTFMVAGHDTTAAGMYWNIYFLGVHLDIQQRAYEEIKNVIGDHEGPISYDQLKDMKYLEAVIKESLRICTPVPLFARSINEDLPVGKYVIPSGATVLVVPYLLHRDPNYFPNPESFEPERFLDGSNKKWHPYAYIPFSAGERKCIGQNFAMLEEKTVLVHFLRKYKVTVIKDVDGHVKGVSQWILRPSKKIQLKIENRI